MHISAPIQSGPCRSGGFTLTELMVSMAIFILVMLAVLSTHVMGMKLFTLTASKLSATEDARNAMQMLDTDIRSAKTIMIGSGTNIASFVPMPYGSNQQGASILIYPTTNTSNCVLYYLKPDLKQLQRVSTFSARPKVVAEFLTNTVLFASEDTAGQVLTDNNDNRVIRVQLQFYQIQYPVVTIGPRCYYDYFQVSTRVTRRTLE